jgi:hypothetical protein
MKKWYSVIVTLAYMAVVAIIFVGLYALFLVNQESPTTEQPIISTNEIAPEEPEEVITITKSKAKPIVEKKPETPIVENPVIVTPAPEQEINNSSQVYIIQQPEPIVIPAPIQPPATIIIPTAAVNQPIVMPQEEKKSQKKIEIISPMANKGLGRTYLARPILKDEFNYIDIGLVVYDDDGKIVDNVKVDVVATDTSQNKSMNGTGNVTRIYPDGSVRVVPYYFYEYEFRTPGEHTITFSAEGLTKSVTLNAPLDERPD